MGPATGVLLVMVATLVVLYLPEGEQRPSPPPGYLPQVSGLSEKLSRVFPSKSPLSIREDFRVDLRNWQGAGDWSRTAGAVRIGRLRLWKPTLALTDYYVHFEAQIDSDAVGWAFRAQGPENYYATKISIAKANRPEIVRYVVLDGKALNKVELPIPIHITSQTICDVKVRVKGDRFTTMLNGRVVDAWSDHRLKRGGVGFFNDPGERATLRWVSVSERESFLERFLTFSFLIAPVDLQLGEW